MVFFWGAIVFWILAWSANIWIARQKERKLLNLFPPILFGGSIVWRQHYTRLAGKRSIL